jgi:hypothetical protein
LQSKVKAIKNNVPKKSKENVDKLCSESRRIRHFKHVIIKVLIKDNLKEEAVKNAFDYESVASRDERIKPGTKLENKIKMQIEFNNAIAVENAATRHEPYGKLTRAVRRKRRRGAKEPRQRAK